MTPDKNTLVGRLRAVRSGDPVLIGTIIDDLCDEAADAIERQSRIIEAHQQQIKDGADTIERLTRENELLGKMAAPPDLVSFVETTNRIQKAAYEFHTRALSAESRLRTVEATLSKKIDSLKRYTHSGNDVLGFRERNELLDEVKVLIASAIRTQGDGEEKT